MVLKIIKGDLFLVELVTASLDRLPSLTVEPKFSFELLVANDEDRLSWKEDRWLADDVLLLRLALLFLMFSRELETDFGGSMLSRPLPNPGSDN